ncbi:unnamed protein product [Caenorhabditis auriculariae]|uniref:Uncharacterized protein n=1 Tax=Caenorhabditis auriculariae TaxID=2777116 RepID=A0A8S1HKM0_9PELO|nr:unnamed protein product [Caenorhabditis auriculariae]
MFSPLLLVFLLSAVVVNADVIESHSFGGGNFTKDKNDFCFFYDRSWTGGVLCGLVAPCTMEEFKKFSEIDFEQRVAANGKPQTGQI